MRTSTHPQPPPIEQFQDGDEKFYSLFTQHENGYECETSRIVPTSTYDWDTDVYKEATFPTETPHEELQAKALDFLLKRFIRPISEANAAFDPDLGNKVLLYDKKKWMDKTSQYLNSE